MAYVPRLTAPEAGNPYWTSTRAGGYNGQIVPADYGSLSAWSNSVLANCTGYVHGRWMELGGVTSEIYGLSNGNAAEYWGHADGLERGQTPRLGAIACYSGGLYGGAGHVAVVEQINPDGSLVFSQSDYGLDIFATPTVPAGSYNPWSASGLVFQGFIYHPAIKPEQTYKITVKNGNASKYEGKEGDKVQIIATVPTGYKFVRWTATAGKIENALSSSTNYTFSNYDASIEAILQKQVKKGKIWMYISPPVYRRSA